jgi:tryptophan-rich sensory protein
MKPLVLFGAQLALNVAWSGLFFTLESPGAAAIEVLLLWAAIATTLVTFWRVRRAAGALLAPYLAWVSFAAVLNFAVWQLNR